MLSPFLSLKRHCSHGIALNRNPEHKPDKRTRRRLACFVAAPPFVDISPVLHVLREMNIDPVLPSPSPTTASSFAEAVPRTIGDSDFVLGLLSAETSNSAVYYEIGAAIALKKRTLLVMEPGITDIPSNIQDLLYVRARLSEGDVIQYALNQLLATIAEPTPKVTGSVERTKPLGRRVDPLLRRLNGLERTGTEQELGSLVSDTLRASGITVTASTKQVDLGFDFAVWADELNAWVGNPLLVEVKRSLAPGDDLDSIETQLQSRLSESNARWALLLYGGGISTEVSRRGARPRQILVMSVRELLEGLRQRSFGEVIREARNRIVHGTGSE